MKIISCHIDNFGKIKDFDYTFKSGINVICEENGWGKSTLSVFFRVMLYGFENENAKDAYKCERKRFKPWSGGIYGGKLIVEAGDKKYCISKIFADKPANDEVDIRDAITNIKIDLKGQSLGEKIFDLGRESFSRTVHITQNHCQTVTDSNINAKLGHITDDTNDINNYESVVKELNDALNKLTPKSKKGKIKNLQIKISELEHEIRDRKSTELTFNKLTQSVVESKTEENKLKARLIKVREDISRVTEYEKNHARKEIYNEILNVYKERKREYNARKEEFGELIPSREDMEKFSGDIKLLAKYKWQSKGFEFNEDEECFFKDNEKIFAPGMPGEGEIEAVNKDIRLLNELKDRIDNSKLPIDVVTRLTELEEKFSNGIPSRERMNELEIKLQIKNEKQQDLRQKQANLSMLEKLYEERKAKAEKDKEESIKKKKTIIATGFILLICAFMSAFVFRLSILGLTTVIISIIVLVSGLMIKIKNEDTDHTQIDNLLFEISKDKKEIYDIDTLVEVFKSEYPFDYGNNFQMSLYNIRNDVMDYEKLSKLREKTTSDKDKISFEKLNNKIYSYLLKYNPTLMSVKTDYREYASCLTAIENRALKYKELKQKKKNQQDLAFHIKETEDTIKMFLDKIGWSNGEADDNYDKILAIINEKLFSYENSLKEYNDICNKKKQFESENEDYDVLIKSEQIIDIEPDLDKLNEERKKIEERLEIVISNIRTYQKQLDESEERLDTIKETLELIEEIEEEKEKAEEKFELYQKTLKYLTEAKQRFTNKYTGPIKDNFNKYYDMLNDCNADDYCVDADINLSKEVHGILRSIDYLSVGQKDIVGICMRMALIESMYKSEKPFVIFDDPFTNFDDNSVNRAKDFINKIGKEYQVIYFTCHKSRTV